MGLPRTVCAFVSLTRNAAAKCYPNCFLLLLRKISKTANSNMQLKLSFYDWCCLVPRPHFSSRPKRFGSRGPCENVLSARSPRIRDQNELTARDWENAVQGLGNDWCISILSSKKMSDANHRSGHPRRPRGSQAGREKRGDESFQVRANEPLGTDSHRTISKSSSGYRLLIGHKKCFVLLCPIGEQFLLSSFREFVHDGYCLATLARFVHQACTCKGNFYFLLS